MHQNPKINEENARKLMVERGLSAKAAARELGKDVSPAGLRAALPRFGIVPRSRSEAARLRYKSLTDEEWLYWGKRYHDENLTMKEVSDQIGQAVPTISVNFDRLGIKARARGTMVHSNSRGRQDLTSEEQAEAVRMNQEERANLVVVAARLKKSERVVRQRMKEAGYRFKVYRR